MSNVFVVRPIAAGFPFASTDKLIEAISLASAKLKGHTGLKMLRALPNPREGDGEYVTEVFRLRADGKFVEDASFIFLLGPKAVTAIREHYESLVYSAYNPSEQPEHFDPVSLEIIHALRCSLTKFQTPCVKSECSENCVMLEIRNAMDESL
jgi:hypothetical protein